MYKQNTQTLTDGSVSIYERQTYLVRQASGQPRHGQTEHRGRLNIHIERRQYVQYSQSAAVLACMLTKNPQLSNGALCLQEDGMAVFNVVDQ